MISIFLVFFFKQKTAYEMRISDWSSDVCSSDLLERQYGQLDKAVALSDEYVNAFADQKQVLVDFLRQLSFLASTLGPDIENVRGGFDLLSRLFKLLTRPLVAYSDGIEPSVQQYKTLLDKVSSELPGRSEEHTSEIQS